MRAMTKEECDREWSQILSGEIPSNYNEEVTDWTPIYQWIINDLLTSKDDIDTVIDFGCGLGHLVNMLYNHNFHTIAVDWSKVALEETKRRCPYTETYLCKEHTDILSAWADEYDAVCFTEVLEHMEEDLQLISTIPSGKIVYISVPVSEGSELSAGHVRKYTVESALERYGQLLDIIKYECDDKFLIIKSTRK